MGLNAKKVFLAIPAVIFGADWLIKRHIDRVMEQGEEKEACGGRLILKKHYNEGAAFGLFASYPKAVTTIHGVLLSVAAVCYAVLLPKKGKTGIKISTGMLLGGGLCNFVDRFKHKHVLDYMSVPSSCRFLRNIVFNLSDIFVLAGALCNLIGINLAKKSKDRKKG